MRNGASSPARENGKVRIAFVTASGITVTSFMMPQLMALRNAGAIPMVASGGTGWQEMVIQAAAVDTLTLNIARRRLAAGDAGAIWRLVRWFRRQRPDVVVGSTPKGMLYGMLAARLAGVPRRVAYYRGLVGASDAGRSGMIGLAVERAAARFATEHVAVSSSLLDEARRLGVLAEPEGMVIGPGMSRGVDVAGLARQAAEQPAPSLAPVGRRFVWVGRCARRKGFDRLARLWPAVRSALPDATLAIVGGLDDSDLPEATSIEWLGSDPSVTLTGWSPMVGSWLGSSDVLLFPSPGEGFPNAPMEAAALGVPTIGFDVMGVRDAIVSGQTGVLVQAGDLDGFVNAAVRLALDGDLRDTMGSAASRRVREHFEQDAVTARHLRFLLKNEAGRQ